MRYIGNTFELELGILMTEALRHNWGGNPHKRERAIREKTEARVELIEYPYKDAKFGTGQIDDYNFLFIPLLEGLRDLDSFVMKL